MIGPAQRPSSHSAFRLFASAAAASLLTLVPACGPGIPDDFDARRPDARAPDGGAVPDADPGAPDAAPSPDANLEAPDAAADAAAGPADAMPPDAPPVVVAATVRINEVKANIANGCDLVEVRVIAGGELGGFTMRARGSSVLVFPTMQVAKNDLIVVHIDSNDTRCNPSGSASETMSITDQPAAIFTGNFDTAFDLYSPTTGLVATTNVFQIDDETGAIHDAVIVSNGTTTTNPSASSAAAVAAAGQWTAPDGSVPAGGFVDADFHDNAVQDLGGTDSLQRVNNADNNHRNDWLTNPAAASPTSNQAATFGALNPGQSAL